MKKVVFLSILGLFFFAILNLANSFPTITSLTGDLIKKVEAANPVGGYSFSDYNCNGYLSGPPPAAQPNNGSTEGTITINTSSSAPSGFSCTVTVFSKNNGGSCNLTPQDITVQPGQQINMLYRWESGNQNGGQCTNRVTLQASTPPPTPTPTPPPTPTNVSATPSCNQIALNWTVLSGVNYRVIRTDNAFNVNVGNSGSYTDTNLANSTSYGYNVYAWNSNGQSSPATVSATTPNCTTLSPPGVSGSASCVSTTPVIDLWWSLPAGSDQIWITRVNDTAINSPIGNPGSYRDGSPMNPGTNYQYLVHYHNPGNTLDQSGRGLGPGWSPPGSVNVVAVDCSPVIPSAPTITQMVPSCSSNTPRMNLNIYTPSPNIDVLDVWRADTGSFWVNNVSGSYPQGSTVTWQADGNVANNSQYTYRVRQRNTSGNWSDWSNQVTGYTGNCTPPAITQMIPECSSGNPRMGLYFQTPSNTPNISQIQVQRTDNGFGITQQVFPAPAQNMFWGYDNNVGNNSTYTYMIREWSSNGVDIGYGTGWTPWSNQSSGTTPSCSTLPPPTVFGSSNCTPNGIVSLWWSLPAASDQIWITRHDGAVNYPVGNPGSWVDANPMNSNITYTYMVHYHNPGNNVDQSGRSLGPGWSPPGFVNVASGNCIAPSIVAANNDCSATPAPETDIYVVTHPQTQNVQAIQIFASGRGIIWQSAWPNTPGQGHWGSEVGYKDNTARGLIDNMSVPYQVRFYSGAGNPDLNGGWSPWSNTYTVTSKNCSLPGISGYSTGCLGNNQNVLLDIFIPNTLTNTDLMRINRDGNPNYWGGSRSTTWQDLVGSGETHSYQVQLRSNNPGNNYEWGNWSTPPVNAGGTVCIPPSMTLRAKATGSATASQPNEIAIPAGSKVTLDWTTQNATYCETALDTTSTSSNNSFTENWGSTTDTAWVGLSSPINGTRDMVNHEFSAGDDVVYKIRCGNNNYIPSNTIPVQVRVRTLRGFIQTQGGDVHTNEQINTPGGP